MNCSTTLDSTHLKIGFVEIRVLFKLADNKGIIRIAPINGNNKYS